MGVSYQAVSNWERGNSMPDISKLPELAGIFRVSVDSLLAGNSGGGNDSARPERRCGRLYPKERGSFGRDSRGRAVAEAVSGGRNCG